MNAEVPALIACVVLHQASTFQMVNLLVTMRYLAGDEAPGSVE
jgi:hypothetical protein